MESAENRMHCVRVKRKASEQPLVGNKRCKLIGSISSRDERKDTLQFKESELEVIDLECLPQDSKLKNLFRQCNDEITCNGVKLNKVEEGFVYDYYIYDDDCFSEDEESENDEELSSCDENHPYNDYPDEDEYDYEEYDYYREWEDDEQRKMKETVQFMHESTDYDVTEDFNE